MKDTFTIRLSDEYKNDLTEIMQLEYGAFSQREFFEHLAYVFSLERIDFNDKVMRTQKEVLVKTQLALDALLEALPGKSSVELETCKLQIKITSRAVFEAENEVNRLQGLVNKYIELSNRLVPEKRFRIEARANKVMGVQ